MKDEKLVLEAGGMVSAKGRIDVGKGMVDLVSKDHGSLDQA